LFFFSLLYCCGCLLACVAASSRSRVCHPTPTLAPLSLASMAEPRISCARCACGPALCGSPARVPERAARGTHASVSPHRLVSSLVSRRGCGLVVVYRDG
jgi:hypothetical protein